ncbi:hypothetical protein NEF87_004663 [Candidatus Lokiarchaeum ossiferum]|uniref:GTP-binding protein n=1 Tax=Candidatus Lokiarchaeum ossiferum TaxID=2951803 RepID=A0ABY6HYA9_9ARCH|nr:hypothetical protein NEF87_004663 [Candidatus Lokiarchaeum sp. B-35]
MKNVPISDELFNRVMKYQEDKSLEAFEPVAKRMMGIYDLSPTQEKKIMLIGEAGVGKSTIRQTFFNYDDPKKMLENSLEPTRGVENFNYIISDINLLVLDTAGQEIEELLEKDPEMHFSDVDAVIYVVDASKYQQENMKIYDLLYRINKTAKFYSPEVKISLYLHKIDLIKEDAVKTFKFRANSRHKGYELTEKIEIPMFFTSIEKEFIKQLELAFLNLFYL